MQIHPSSTSTDLISTKVPFVERHGNSFVDTNLGEKGVNHGKQKKGPALFGHLVSSFEKLKRTSTSSGIEHWSARDLYSFLGYSRWENFKDVVEKAIKGLEESGGNQRDHFRRAAKMIEVGKGGRREVDDVFMTRRGCYLVAMNGLSAIPEIAVAQNYFASQTIKQERQEKEMAALNEAEKRIYLRNELAEHNKALASTAKKTGVETPFDYAIFHSVR